MAQMRAEKPYLELPAQLTPDTVYYLRDETGHLQIHVSDRDGLDTITISTTSTTGSGRLYNTPKLPIHGNRIRLPSVPNGDILYEMMLVWDADGVMVEYDGVTLVQELDAVYAVLNEPYTVEGYGRVAYIPTGGPNG